MRLSTHLANPLRDTLLRLLQLVVRRLVELIELRDDLARLLGGLLAAVLGSELLKALEHPVGRRVIDVLHLQLLDGRERLRANTLQREVVGKQVRAPRARAGEALEDGLDLRVEGHCVGGNEGG